MTDGGNGQQPASETDRVRVWLIKFAPGERYIHDLENVGGTVLSFVTVEFLDSANAPLRLKEENQP